MNTKVTYTRLDLGTAHDVSEEFTLPDYLPEIRRIVTYNGCVLPDSKYIDRGEIALSGIVVYTVYYLGEDGSLNAVPLNSEYTVQMSCQGADLDGLSAPGLLVKTALESVSCRATAPRRLMLTGRMRSKAFSVGKKEIAERVSDGSDGKTDLKCEMTLERLRESVRCSDVFTTSVTGEIAGELREREGAKLISCDGGTVVTDTRLDGEYVSVRGEAYVNCLVMSPEGEYSTIRLKAPFEEKLPMSNDKSVTDRGKCGVSAVSRCASVNLSGGDGGVYNWTMEYDVDAFINVDYEADLTRDMYSTLYETSLTKGEADVVSCLKNTSSRLSLNNSKQIIGGEGKSAPHVTAKAGVDRAECNADGKIVINGNCTVSAMLVGGGEVTTESVDIPYRFECDGRSPEGGETSILHDVSVISADARLDGDRLSVSAELGISLIATAEGKNTYIEEVTVDSTEKVGLSGNCVKIYFPYENETMWDIGKKYHCEQKHIKQTDGMKCVVITVD